MLRAIKGKSMKRIIIVILFTLATVLNSQLNSFFMYKTENILARALDNKLESAQDNNIKNIM